MDTTATKPAALPVPADQPPASPPIDQASARPEAAATEPPPEDGEDRPPPPEWTPEQPHFNAMRERFCLAFVNTPNATRAAAFAGYSMRSARQLGSRLLKDPYILLRIEELRLKHGVIYEVPRDMLLDRLEMLFWQAVETNNLGVALGATAFQAKLAGHTMPGRFPPRPSTETLHLIAKMSSIYTARRMGQALADDETQFAEGYSPRWRKTGKQIFEQPFEDIHRHYTAAPDGSAPKRGKSEA